MGIFGTKDDKEPDFSNLRGGSSSTAPSASAAVASERTYVVVEGDSLSAIAKRMLGDGNKWRKIYEANRDIIDDPDLIFPGQKLRIPE
jgi:nucleoid-associated protein YgaU